MFKNMVLSVCSALLLLSAPFGVKANAVDITGSRSTVFGELEAYRNLGLFVAPTGLQIDWKITPNVGSFHYKYTLSNPVGGDMFPGFKSFILEVNPLVNTGNLNSTIFNTSPSIVDGPRIFDSSDLNNFPTGNPFGEFYGINFEFDPGASVGVVEFDSTLIPELGDFYTLTDGLTGFGDFLKVQGFNLGLGLDPSQFSSDFFIAVPGGQSINVPEPGTWLALGTVLMIAVLAGRRKLWLRKAEN